MAVLAPKFCISKWFHVNFSYAKMWLPNIFGNVDGKWIVGSVPHPKLEPTLVLLPDDKTLIHLTVLVTDVVCLYK